MNQKEIETGQEYREWPDILDYVRTELNKERKIKKMKTLLIINTLMFKQILNLKLEM